MNLKTPEIIGLGGLIFSVVSIRLHWGLQQRLASIEDRIKDGRLNAPQAETRMRFWKSFPPALSLTGVALLIWAAFDLLS